MLDFKDMPKDELLLSWRAEAIALKNIKARESAMRAEIVRRMFPTIQEGTQREPLGNGYAVKAVHKLNYNLETDRAKFEHAVAAMVQAGNEAPFIIDRLIKRKPELSISEYRALEKSVNDGDGTARAIMTALQTVLTIKPGSTEIEIEEPKA